MSDIAEVLRIGAGHAPITVSLTTDAVDLLRDLPGGGTGMPLADHRAILTTIVVARAAGGGLDQGTVLIDAEDIRKVLDHAGMSRT